jgi:hypothetical protein
MTPRTAEDRAAVRLEKDACYLIAIIMLVLITAIAVMWTLEAGCGA